MKRSLTVISILVICLILSMPLFAQENTQEGNGFWSKDSVKIFTAGFAMAFASALCGIAQGIGISAACKGASRNPAIAGKLQMMMIIGLVFIESLVLYTLLIVFVKV
ncbi:MAG: ATP synthase F0 subunit C [Acidobacteriota bacterium]